MNTDRRTLDRTVDIRAYLERISHAVGRISTEELVRASEALTAAYTAGRTIFTCGNGGSAATASHLAVDMAKNTRCPGVPPVRTVSLVDHVPALTAWANDVGYDAVFSGQLEGLLEPGDVLVAISTSGDSPNVLRALEFARGAGAVTVGLLGQHGGQALRLCDVAVTAPVMGIEEQEDLHMSVAHLLTRQLRSFVREHAAAINRVSQ